MLFLMGAINTVFIDVLILAAIIGLGALLGWIFEIIHIPSVTGYVLSGITIGIFLLASNNEDRFTDLRVLENIALSFIAFELGTRLYLKKVSHNLSEVIVIVLFQAVFTIGLVWLLFFVFGAPWEMALLISVIAMATSPETIMVISRKYKTKGNLTDAIMPHIGLDDIIGVVLFAIALAIASAVNTSSDVSTEAMILEPLLEIFGSMIVGGIIGGILALFIFLTRKKESEHKKNYLTETIFVIVLVTALSIQRFQIGDISFILSPILLPMFAGIVFTNLVPKAVRKDNDEAIDAFTPPFILIFFALIGIQLVVSFTELSISVWLLLGITTLYAIVRVIGKQLGVFLGSKVKETPKEIVKYLVWSLLPQATVSIGMATVVLNEESLPEEWRKILFMVVILAGAFYQLIGPIIAERALAAAHEIEPEKLTYFIGHKDKEEPEGQK